MAEGEIMTTPLAMATFCRIAVVTPEQSAPIMALTLSDVIRRSATAVAAAESMQVESPRTTSIFDPPIKEPLSFTSDIASSAPAAMAGVSDSMGPVKPRIIPILTSSATAWPVSSVAAAKARNTFLIRVLPKIEFVLPWPSVHVGQFRPGGENYTQCPVDWGN